MAVSRSIPLADVAIQRVLQAGTFILGTVAGDRIPVPPHTVCASSLHGAD